jgi:DNA polymerase-1
MAMRHVTFSDSPTHKIALLIKGSSFFTSELDQYYVSPLDLLGVSRDSITAFTVDYSGSKAPVALCKSYLATLLPALLKLGTEVILCADSTYFKVLTGAKNSDSSLGYVKPCIIKGYGHIQVIYTLNHSALVYNPAQQPKIDLSLNTLAQHLVGTVPVLGKDIIHSAIYPDTVDSISSFLGSLLEYKELTVDIEAFSLSLQEAKLGSISFAWDKHNGGAFLIDYTPLIPESGYFGYQYKNTNVRSVLRQFFESYKGKLIAHSCTYDFKVLIYELWMKDPLDQVGLLKGLNILTRLFDDTKIIAYLALNSTADIELSLKKLAHEYAGDYAQSEIKDIRKIPPDVLLKYNLIDCLSTWFVKEKYEPVMISDQQEELYQSLMLPSLKVIIQMELTGMPISSYMVKKTKKELKAIQQEHLDTLANNQSISVATGMIRQSMADAANKKLKKLRKTASDFKQMFNPNSSQHLATLLHQVMDLPVLETTATGLPATGVDVLKSLRNHTTDPTYLDALNALIELGKVDKILSAFIPAFEKAYPKADGRSYLHGNFNLGGTVSGRLSSSNPNLQNIPSGSTYGNKIKSCFISPPGWIMVYADFSSLEDKISALITKDPNKLKIYIDGYDSHSLRAYNYFPDKYVGIPDTLEGINGAVKTHKEWRQMSKAPTFLLTYGGTYHGLMKNCGFSKEMALSIESNYHKMYSVSDQWVQSKIDQACVDGYVTCAFGLRVRTPLLKQSVLGTSKTMREAQGESRTAGNALGQSYCAMNARAAVEFMGDVHQSPYKHDILPIAQIHDAIYLLVKDDLDTLKFVNDRLVAAMSWQELPELQHDLVKIGAEVDVCFQGWHQTTTLPNHATKEEILNLCKEAAAKYSKE